MEKIEHALKSGGNSRAVKRKLRIGEHRAHALGKKKDSVATHIYFSLLSESSLPYGEPGGEVVWYSL